MRLIRAICLAALLAAHGCSEPPGPDADPPDADLEDADLEDADRDADGDEPDGSTVAPIREPEPLAVGP